MNSILHILTASTFIVLPRLVSILRWFTGIIGFCNNGTNYIILVGILSSNLLHILNIGNTMKYKCTWRKYFFLASIVPALIIDIVMCWVYLIECLNPNMDPAFIIVSISSMILNIIPNILARMLLMSQDNDCKI